MFTENKYYGEIWFEENENFKCFCILTINDRKVSLETNLAKKKSYYKEKIILGTFTGLGYLTFIDCQIKLSQSGITEARIYQPKYCFISAYHFVKITDLKFKKFRIGNDAIVDWIFKSNWYDFIEDKLIKETDVTNQFNIKEIGLSIEIKQSSSFTSGHKEFALKNNGYLTFESDNEISLLNAFDYYNSFQKLLQFISAKTQQFTFFSFQCLGCEKYIDLYYKEDRFEKSGSNYIHLFYDEIVNDLPVLIKNIYTSDSFKFCLDKLMENLLGFKLSYSRRFTNSIATFEAYNKLYLDHKNNKLTYYLEYNKENIIAISKMNEVSFKDFKSTVVRSRDYHVHSNLNNKDIYSDFELLYISFLFDYVVGLGLLQNMKVSNEVLNKVIMQGQSVFVYMQSSNKFLSQDPFEQEKTD
ncbi:hypothetical protein AAEO57_20270 [Flavobacterium sp. DGU38]|uniref:ApeA N-terminal domain-containing protein n=1 Tax=Flavobacterium calami TaxID=3139144 RepID=A0ABU9IVI9_9FLAO